MKLLEQDEEYLNSKQYDWEFILGNNEGYLIIKNYRLKSDRYNTQETDLMIRIPNGYNMAALDMFYVDPHIRLKDTDDYPPAANSIETYIDRQWQRFSRHLNPGEWRAGIDGIETILSHATKELQR